MGSRTKWQSLAVGVLTGAAYALLDWALDHWHQQGVRWQVLELMHHAVDTLVPLVLGGLAGLGIHHVHLRKEHAAVLHGRALDLQTRLSGVERDQAVWVVAAATLHELKNPLHAMGLVLEEMEGALPSDHPTHAARLRALLDRVGVHVNTLRGFSRDARPSLQPVALGPTIQEVWNQVMDLQGQHPCSFSMEGIPTDTRVHADPAQLRFLLENLLNNAVENTHHQAGQAQVRVQGQSEAGVLQLEVADSGPAADAAWTTAMFDPLQTTKPGGLGLGLPIARALARGMGGDLAYITPKGGPRFLLTLRRAEAP